MGMSDNPRKLTRTETLLKEAADTVFRYDGAADQAAALVAKVREKLPNPEWGTGGELRQPGKGSGYLYSTLDWPDFIAADASSQRMNLALEAGALALGVDTADTIQAANSAERMLAHQLGALHAGAMRLMGQMADMIQLQGTAIRTDDSANLRVTRLAGAVSRMTTAYQNGLVTLDRLRSGGKQTIVVQHVQVNEGGQAVVAGKVKGAGKRGGGRSVESSRVSPPGSQNSGGKSPAGRGRGRK